MALEIFNVRAILQGSVVGTDQYAAFNRQLTNVGRNADVVNRQMNQLTNTMKTAAAGLGGFQIGSLIADFAKASMQVDAFEKQLSQAYGQSAGIQLEILRSTMRNLGVSMEESLGSAVRFTSSLKLAGQSAADTNKTFESATKLILANKLSADGAQRVYYAMSQIASKGKLMSEELQGQLAENLAGISQQISAAMGLPVAEVLKQMKEGKVTSGEFFDALNKLASNIDPRNLESAAQSLGKMKNAWFDFKSSVIGSDDIKTFLDGVTVGLNALAENVGILSKVIGATLVAAMSRYLVLTSQSTAASVARSAALRTEIALELQKAQLANSAAQFRLAGLTPGVLPGTSTNVSAGTARNLLAAQNAAEQATRRLRDVEVAARQAGVGLNAFQRAGQSILGFFGGPWGLALTAASVGLTALAMRTSEAEKANQNFERTQRSMAEVIDLTTGKLKSQNEELILQNKINAEKSAKTSREQFEIVGRGISIEIGQALPTLAVQEGSRFAQFTEEQIKLSRAVYQAQISGEDLEASIKKLSSRFPEFSKNILFTKDDILEYSQAFLQAKQAQLLYDLSIGKTISELERTKYLLGGISTVPKADPSNPDTDAYNDVKKNLMVTREQRTSSERQAYIIEQLVKAKLADFDATGKLNVVSGKYSDEIRNLAGATFDANERFKAQKEAISQLNTLYADVAGLQFRLEYMDKFGVKAASSEEAVVRYRIAHTDLKNASEETKRSQLSAAQALDILNQGLKQKSTVDEFSDSLGKQAAELEQQIFFFRQYGDKIETTREAVARYRITQGDMINASEEEKRNLLEQALYVDRLAQQYGNLKEASQRAANVLSFRASAQDAAREYQDRIAAMRGGSSKQIERSSFEADLDKKIDDYRRAAIAAGATAADMQEYARQFADEKIKALAVYDEAQRQLTEMEQDWLVGAKQAIRSYGEEIANVAAASARAWENAFRATEDALVNFVMTGKLNFSDLAMSIIADITRIAIQQAIMRPLMGMFGMPFANGGVLMGGQVQKYAQGGIVTRPTLFPMATGAGLMGEAGPEAIMPLKRLSSGKLGVEASGGGTQNVTVNVNVEGGQQQTAGDPGKASELGKAIANAVRAELVVQKRPGGLLA